MQMYYTNDSLFRTYTFNQSICTKKMDHSGSSLDPNHKHFTRITFYPAAMSHYVNESWTNWTRNHLWHSAAIFSWRHLRSLKTILILKLIVINSVMAFSVKRDSSRHISARHTVKVKVKCTLVQALRLCTGRTAHRGSRSIALLFLDHGTRRGWAVNVTPQPLFTTGKDPVPIVQEAGWAPGPVWTCAENLAPIWIRSLDHPVRSQSLYRPRYPAHPSHGAIHNSNRCLPALYLRTEKEYFSETLCLCSNIERWTK